jgi:hypothetical protein
MFGGIDLKKQRNLVLYSANLLSGGGIIENQTFIGNAGWQIAISTLTQNQDMLCNDKLNTSSVVMNLDGLGDWQAHRYQPNTLMRGVDNESLNNLSLPGYTNNANTMNTNIYFDQSKGITFKGTPVKIEAHSVDNIANNNLVSFGGASKIIADAFQPQLSLNAGSPCNSNELGKMVVDAGINNNAQQYLARSTLVCTKSDILCSTGYCYLSTVNNHVILQNNIIGINDKNGNFICPAQVPYATTVKVNQRQVQVHIFYNQGSTPQLFSSTNITIGQHNGQILTYNFTCPLCTDPLHTDFLNSQLIPQLLGIDLATIRGNGVGNINLPITNAIPIVNYADNYSLVVGYKLPAPENCQAICPLISQLLGNSWQDIGTQRLKRIGSGVFTANAQLGCACERTDFRGNGDSYSGIAGVIGDINSKITAVECSNNPVFKLVTH